jgi:hypothetical protein
MAPIAVIIRRDQKRRVNGKKVTQVSVVRRHDFVHTGTSSPNCGNASFRSSAGASYTSNQQPSGPPRRGDAVEALEEEEEPTALLLAVFPLFKPTLRLSKTSLLQKQLTDVLM